MKQNNTLTTTTELSHRNDMKRPACSSLLHLLQLDSILASGRANSDAPPRVLPFYQHFSSGANRLFSSFRPKPTTTAFITYKFVPSRQILQSRLPKLFGKPTPSPIEEDSIFEEIKGTGLKLTSEGGIEESCPPIRVGILGGGVAGVSVAHSLATKFTTEAPPFHITVIEGDCRCRSSNVTYSSNDDPWTAATARNANSLVPAAAMHVFSRPSVVWKVLQDTVVEWYELQVEKIQKKVGLGAKTQDEETLFAEPPPYFALNLLKCLGPTASGPERWSFANFFSQFLFHVMAGGADKRGRSLCQLAQANRVQYLRALDQLSEKTSTTNGQHFGHSQGFVSLHRTQKAAQESVDEARSHGEAAELISDWKEVVSWMPRVENLPMAPNLYAVRRPNDYTASCERFIKYWIEESCATGIVEYERDAGNVNRLQIIPTSSTTAALSSTQQINTTSQQKRVFRVSTEDGSTYDFDLLVLAAGTATPLLAAQLGAGNYCPTYPLRGYSLTVFVDEKDKASNLLRQPFSVDSLYCSSVTPNMARLAGFGELVGYREKAGDVPSLGPAVLSRYARRLFPDAVHTSPDDVLSCFRPITPDDLPLAGEIPTHPGLFLHTGHGTLGWTCGLASGECVARTVVDRMKGHNTQEGVFTLADNTTIDRRILSPKRFVG